MMRMTKGRRSYNDKRPRPHALAPREHYVKKNGSWKPKMEFPNIASADNYIQHRAFFRDNGYIAYECSVCHKIHIGKITDKNDDTE